MAYLMLSWTRVRLPTPPLKLDRPHFFIKKCGLFCDIVFYVSQIKAILTLGELQLRKTANVDRLLDGLE